MHFKPLKETIKYLLKFSEAEKVKIREIRGFYNTAKRRVSKLLLVINFQYSIRTDGIIVEISVREPENTKEAIKRIINAILEGR